MNSTASPATRARVNAGDLVSSDFLLWMLLAVGVVIVMWSPVVLRERYIDPDSGVFLYGGWRILHGAVPYRDFWDQKGPVIFYINAVGLLLGHGSIWGVLAVQFAALLAAGALGFDCFRRAFGRGPALIAMAACLATLPFILVTGNYVEEYALPLQFAAIWCFARAEAGSRRAIWVNGAIGVVGGLAFLLVPTTAGLWVAIAFYRLV
jgi:4-amino-4-deoxy-L-arabinose transferase-like glycosyltransferase